MIKRRLAASVVVTMSVVACNNHSEPPRVLPQGHNPPEIIFPQEPPDTHTHNPPAIPNMPVGMPGELQHEGIACYWQPAQPPVHCPPDADCNPPAPQPRFQVQCPAEHPALPEVPAGAKVMTRPDGTCFYWLQTPEMECPPDASCNPPKPEAIDVPCVGYK